MGSVQYSRINRLNDWTLYNFYVTFCGNAVVFFITYDQRGSESFVITHHMLSIKYTLNLCQIAPNLWEKNCLGILLCELMLEIVIIILKFLNQNMRFIWTRSVMWIRFTCGVKRASSLSHVKRCLNNKVLCVCVCVFV